jgi:Zn-dependent peptidase ImmA (M78 family)
MSEEEAATAAERFRENNGLGIAPIADLIALIEQAERIGVTVLPVADDNEHGLTMVDPDRGATIVAVATSERPMRWRSNLAHELGHLVFHDHVAGEPASLAEKTPAEERARAFARHLLLPAAAVSRFVAQIRTFDLAALSDLVQRFQVSPAIAAVQLRDGGHIDDERCQEWSKIGTPRLAAEFGWADHYRALQALSATRRAPQRLLARATSGYLKGVVSLETLAGIRGITAPEIASELEAAGLTPDSLDGTTPPADVVSDEPGEFIDLSWLDDE